MALRARILAFWLLIICHFLGPVGAIQSSERRVICEVHYKVHIQTPTASPVTLHAMLGLDPFAAPFHPLHKAETAHVASYKDLRRGLLDAVFAHLRPFGLHRPVRLGRPKMGKRVWLTGFTTDMDFPYYAQPDTEGGRGPAEVDSDGVGAWLLRAEVASVLLNDELRDIYFRIFLPALLPCHDQFTKALGWLKSQARQLLRKQTSGELERLQKLKALHGICRGTGVHFDMFY